jgi:hypothetical protein
LEKELGFGVLIILWRELVYMVAGLGSDALRPHIVYETYLVMDNLASVCVPSIVSTGVCGEMTLDTFDRYTSKLCPHFSPEVEKCAKVVSNARFLCLLLYSVHVCHQLSATSAASRPNSSNSPSKFLHSILGTDFYLRYTFSH